MMVRDGVKTSVAERVLRASAALAPTPSVVARLRGRQDDGPAAALPH
jgi:hypothetical protein